MKIFKSSILCFLFMLKIVSLPAQTEGFYKDIFMDGGVSLTSRTSLPAADALHLSMEFLASGDTSLQRKTITKNNYDQNGYLLYPDGAPRFAVVYVNGGSATGHGKSLGETGRERFRSFYYNGGSYTGSCAGMFIASVSYMEDGIYEPYFHIWPGRTKQAGLASTYTGHFIPADSPLLKYADFGGDHYIRKVYHNYGGYAREDLDFPEGTEVLLRYDYPDKTMDEKPSCWAYIENDQSGRLVVIGSHPESVTSGERLDLMKAILSYALDGVAKPRVKGTLLNGQERIMDKNTAAKEPAYTKIGDKQYHHFMAKIPPGARNFKVLLSGDDTCDLYLYINREEFAFDGASEFTLQTAGANKTFSLLQPESGTWYIGVKCATTVQSVRQNQGYVYSGRLDILNGSAYSIKASWDTVTTVSAGIKSFKLYQNFPNPFNSATRIRYQLFRESNVNLSVFNALGQRIEIPVNKQQAEDEYVYDWDAGHLPGGVYFIRLKTDGENVQTEKIVLIH